MLKIVARNAFRTALGASIVVAAGFVLSGGPKAAAPHAVLGNGDPLPRPEARESALGRGRCGPMEGQTRTSCLRFDKDRLTAVRVIVMQAPADTDPTRHQNSAPTPSPLRIATR